MSHLSPEAALAQFADRISLQENDIDYLLTLLQEARGLGRAAGQQAERDRCADLLSAQAYAALERLQVESLLGDKNESAWLALSKATVTIRRG